MREAVQRARDGDREAFEEVYRETVGRVYALALRITGDPGQARERTQDVYVRVWERLAGYRGESAFTTWLHTLTVNVCLGASRSQTRRAQWETAADEEYLDAVGAPAAADPVERVALERAIAQLPEGARTVLLLHDVHGYRHEEIAAMTDTRPGTSKAQLHRARQLLRKALGE